MSAVLSKVSLCFAVLSTVALGSGRVRILSAVDLLKALDKVRIVDSRERADFEKGHIPGSRHMIWKDWTEERPGWWNYFFGDPKLWGRVVLDDKLGERLSAMGLSRTTPIVFVGEPHEWGEEGRLAWNFLFWGAEEVALLDGGFSAWRNAGGSIEKGPPQALPRGKFQVTPRFERRALMAEVERAVKAGDRAILDSRTREEFEGKTLQGQNRGGRLPRARLVPELSLYKPDGKYIGADELKALVGKANRPIVYCVGGVRSALLALLLEARLGIVAANYDASIWEWASEKDLPLVTGPPASSAGKR